MKIKRALSRILIAALLTSSVILPNPHKVDAQLDVTEFPVHINYDMAEIPAGGITVPVVLKPHIDDPINDFRFVVITPVNLGGSDIRFSSVTAFGPDTDHYTLELQDDNATLVLNITGWEANPEQFSFNIHFSRDEVKKLLDAGQRNLALSIVDVSDSSSYTMTAFTLNPDIVWDNQTVREVEEGNAIPVNIDYLNMPINVNYVTVDLVNAVTGAIIGTDTVPVMDTAGQVITSIPYPAGLDISDGVRLEVFTVTENGKSASSELSFSLNLQETSIATPVIVQLDEITVERQGSANLSNITINNLQSASEVRLASPTLTFSQSIIPLASGTTTLNLSSVTATVSTPSDFSHSINIEIYGPTGLLIGDTISVGVKQPEDYQIDITDGTPKTLRRGTDTVRSGIVLSGLPPHPLTIQLEADSEFTLGPATWQKAEGVTSFTLPSTPINIPTTTNRTNAMFTLRVLNGTNEVTSKTFMDNIEEREIGSPTVSSDLNTALIGTKTKSGKITISNLPSDLTATVKLSTKESGIKLGTSTFSKETGGTTLEIETDIEVDRRFRGSRFDLDLEISVGGKTFERTVSVRVSELKKGKVVVLGTPRIEKDRPIDVEIEITMPDLDRARAEELELNVKGGTVNRIVNADRNLDVEIDKDSILVLGDRYDGRRYKFTVRITPDGDEITISMKDNDNFEKVDIRLSNAVLNRGYKINGEVTAISNSGNLTRAGNIFIGNNLEEGTYRIYLTREKKAGGDKESSTWEKSPQPEFVSASSKDVTIRTGRSAMLDDQFPNTSYIEFTITRELKDVEIGNVMVTGAKTMGDYDLVLAFTELRTDFGVNDTFKSYLKVNRQINTIALQVGTDVTLVNGEIKKLQNKPIIHQGQPMVQISFVSDALGRFLSWDGSTNTAFISSINNLDETIQLNLSTGAGVKRNGNTSLPFQLKVKPQVVNGRTMVSINDIVTIMNLPQPTWDPISRSIIIKDE